MNDFYPTPEWATRAMLARVPVLGSVLECCSGEDHITDELRRSPQVGRVITNDIDPKFGTDFTMDAADPALWNALPCRVDWVVTNPPFEKAIQIAKLAVENARLGVALLLRLSFIEPTPCGSPERHTKSGRVLPATEARGPWLEQRPPQKMIACPRISFTGDGHTDSVTVAWFIWNRVGLLPGPPIEVIRAPRALREGASSPLGRGGVQRPSGRTGAAEEAPSLSARG